MTASAFHVAIQGGQWVKTDGSTTNPIVGNQVTLNGITYLLVDQFGGGFQHIQDAIDAATGAATILIAPGTYTESGSDGIGRTVGLYINKPDLTLQGVDTAGAPITSAAEAASDGPVIISGHQTGFGANHWVDFGGDNTVFQGVHLQAGTETNNKLLEIWADNVTVENSFIDVNEAGANYTGAAAIYLNDNGTTSSEISSYTITGNILNEGIVVANGVGDGAAHVPGTNQLITNNLFEGTFHYDTGEGRHYTVVINGEVNGIPWLLEPTQTPTISGNTLDDNSTPLLLRGSDNDAANLPTAAQVQAILDSTGLPGDGNAELHYAYVVDSNGDLVTAERLAFDAFTGDPVLDEHGVQLTYHSFAVTNSIDTLNLSLDTTPDNVFGGQRDYIHSGNTIIVQSGDTDSVDSQIMVDNLTIKATAHSGDLDLTLATLYADGSAIPGGVHDVTLADYDGPGHHGANVDVTGNGLTNHIVGNSGANTLDGAGGDDTLEGGRGDDGLVGGSGTDTAVYSGTISVANLSYDDVHNEWTVDATAGGEGTDTLTGMEKVQGADPDGAGHATGTMLLVDENGSFTSIQDAIDAAANGDTIVVAAGTYNENLVVDKEVKIVGLGDVTLHGTFKSDNGISDGGVAAFLKSGAGYTQTAGSGITISADHVTIEGIHIDGFTYGVKLSDGTDGATLTGVDITDSLVGIKKGTIDGITNLTITDGSISDGLIGIDFDKTTTVGQAGVGVADGVVIDGTDFSHLVYKGAYFEALSNAHLTDITMSDVAQFGAPSTSGTLGSGGNGIDLNLKNGAYSNIEIDHFHLTNVGASNQDGGGTSHANGGAIVIESRDDGATYGPAPAALSGVSIHDGTIDGSTSTGIHVGEPGKANLDPDVTVNNVTITGAQHTAAHGDIANEANTTTFTLTGTSGADSLIASTNSDGMFVIDGAGGDDTIAGGSGDDLLTGGSGADALDGRAGVDTASYASSSGGVSINLVTGVGHGGDAEGDTLSGIENVIGSSHNDTFAGDARANVFTGGDGNDVYTVSDSDTVVEVGGSAGGIDEVRSAQTITLADSVENLTLIDGVSDVQTFDDMSLGAITDGENGWQVNGPNAARDQEIVDFGGGNHKFRMSSDPGIPDFAGPYTPELSFAAGEHGTGASFDSQSIDFDFQAVDAAGDGSRLEVDFGIASGQDRNNFLVLESFGGGIRIAVSEPDTNGAFSGNGVDPAPNDWRELVSGVDASVQHHLTMKLHYVDGANNDVIDIFLDDNLIGTTTTFENFRDANGGTHIGNALDNLTDRVFFRPSANGAPQDGAGGDNQGFYFDNVETAVYNSGNINGTGNGLANVITGNSGDNVLTGLAGNDFLDGAAGNDTAAYIATLNPGSFQYDFVNGHWTVTSAADGTDTLTSIGKVTDGSANKFFIVSGDSDFTTTNSTFASTVTGDTVVTEVSVVEGSTFVDDFSSYGLSGTNLGGADAAFFHLDNAGHLVFNAGADFEVPADSGHDNVYRVEFQTTTGKTVTHVYDIRVTNAAVGAVTDGNVADNAISESASNGALVGITASATDGAGSVTYSLTDNAGGRFAIDSSTGVVTVADASLIDFESAAGHSYSITAKASTGGQDASQTFSIAVTNAAPSTPTDSNGATNVVAETVANGATVGITASAADPHGGAVTYSLSDDAGGRFAIDSATGVVTVANASLINTEDGGNYTIKVAAKDASNAASADATFTISVTNVAPSTPTDANGATNVVAENVANGATVGITASAADPHGGAVTYSLSDNAGGRFAIDSSTGVVTVANASLINTEDGGSYTIKVAAKDSSNAASADATFTIGVTNVAPSTPTDSDAAANAVSENAANGTVVHVTAQSADPHGGSVAYTLTDNAGGRFAINASTGIVTVANGSLLDFEAQTSHTITVRAGDTNGGQSTTQTFTIGVLNVAGNTINGSGGADTINGTHGPNGPQAPVGFATNEDDTIHGRAGNDTIHGLGGNDKLFGDAGNDKLFGDNGNDRLDGGVGTDQLSGGANIDTFVFRHGYGHDTVVDYVAGTDKIDLSGTGAHGFGGIHLVKHGANVDIHVGSDILTLAHTTIATINAHHGDFIFA